MYLSTRQEPSLRCCTRLLVERLELGDYLLGPRRIYLHESSASAPIAGYDHHLHLGGLARFGFDDGGGLILGTGLQFVLARRGMDGEPATILKAVHFFAIHVD